VNTRVLVTGSRTWDGPDARRVLYLALTSASLANDMTPGSGPMIVVHGDCLDGADALTRRWADENGCLQDPHPADWMMLGRRAGVIRNAHMVALGAAVCLAFVDPCANAWCTRPRPHGSHGATHCANLAERAGIPVRRYQREWART
jgi:hypothetical protein